MQANTIDEVIALLDQIVEDSWREGARYGFFAALYGGMTRGIQEGLSSGRFVDVAKTTELDVVFANRYFLEFDRWRAGRTTSAVWARAFAAMHERGPLVMQHLLLGMNAHINLDLAISTADVLAPDQVDDFYPDYLEINRVIGELANGYQARVNRLSPWFGLIDWLGGRTDEAIFKFSVVKARDHAWDLANVLINAPKEQHAQHIADADRMMTDIAHLIRNPGVLLGLGVRVVGMAETRNVRAILDVLRAPE